MIRPFSKRFHRLKIENFVQKLNNKVPCIYWQEHFDINSIALVGGGTGARVFIEMEYCEKGDLAKAIASQNGVRFSQRKVSGIFEIYFI